MQSAETIEVTSTEEPAPPSLLKKKWPQIVVVAGTTLSELATGTTLGFSAIAIPTEKTSQSDDALLATVEQQSWSASFLFLGSLAGSLLTSILLGHFGRKRIITLTCVLFVAGWVIIAVSQHVAVLCFGRFISGLCNAFLSVVVPIYVTEITDTELQNASESVRTLGDIMISVGILLVAVMGALLHWRSTAWLCTILPILLCTFMIHVPESPYWLYSKQRMDEMKTALMFLRGSVTNINLDEFQIDCQDSGTLKDFTKTLFILRKPSIWRPFVVCLGLFFIKIFSGAYAITFFGVFIFQTAGGVVSGYLGNIIINTFRVVGALAAAVLSRKIKRRPLFSFSSTILTLAMATMGIYLCIKENTLQREFPSALGFFPVIILVIFIFVFASGVEQVPWIVFNEMFHTKFNSAANKVMSCLMQCLSFSMVQLFHTMMKTMTGYGTFWFLGSVCFCGIFYPFMFLPETKGKSAQEINDYFTVCLRNSAV